ncbi:MAG: catalase family protein [Piscirickettsiaceae bacterium]|nr:catalase family protein [Piscirickettsiaceae bacterium]
MDIIKKLIVSLIILLILLFGFVIYHAQDSAIVTTEEIITDDEPEQIQRSVDNFLGIIKTFQTDKAHRGAHAKGHACVKAYFDINDDLNPELQQGIFKQSDNSYKAWIRFSNGTPKIAKDAEKDSRGIAIKLLNVIEQGQTQEFLLHNSPAFFSINLDDYNGLIESEDKLKYFLNGYNPFNWRLRELSHVLDTLSPPPYSPIWEEYFSNTAYKFGSHNVKYKIQSCQPFNKTVEQDQTDPDFLRKTLATELANGDACLQFMVQVQNPEKHMPIEDPSVLWKESDSPYISIATITIPQQQFDTAKQQQFCENLSFSPWNSLAEHKPIGALNRVRKVVYQASSLYRHQFNKTAVPKPLDW